MSPRTSARRPPRRPASESGVALVLTLAFLALLSILIIAFFSSVQTESQSAKSYAQSVTVKQLVDSATNVVIGQITDATLSTKTVRKPTDTTPIADNQRLTWASQPGMIRTWDTGGTWQAYKLYSSNNMVVSLKGKSYLSAGASAASPEVPNEWATQPALFTDLNSPVTAPDQNGKDATYYPIIDPAAQTFDKVDGFSIDLSKETSWKAPSNQAINTAAMPVRWIYVLKDGSLTTPTDYDATTRTAQWSAGSTSIPTKDNPIVGRVAFWTDDESCKLNLNTASEGTPWDTPRALCKSDLQFGLYQPYNKEYQRYPGHPFNVSLSPLFYPGFRPDATNLNLANPIKLVEKENIYAMIPRVKGGGSAAATSNTNAQITPDADRLYASPDELGFIDSTRKTNTVLSSDRLKRAGFFLTTSSRAPEVNAFGGPRISMWPVDTDSSKRTAFDRLALFCTTLATSSGGSKVYTFQRHDPVSPTNDFSGISRNAELYSYLRNLTSHAIPGFSANSYATKWGDDRDQILTEIFDYIRCTNLRDPQYATTASPNYTYDSQIGRASGQVTPIVIGPPAATNATKGFGRFHSISQFGFHFICSQKEAKGAYTTSDPALKLGSNERMIDASFLFEPFSPSLGFFRLTEDMSFQVNFKTAFTLDGADLKMRGGGKSLLNGIGQGYHNNGREHGGTGGIRGPIAAMGAGNYQYIGTADPSQYFPGISPSHPAVKIYGVKVSTSGGKTTMKFSGGTIEVLVYSGVNPTGTPVQTFELTFPGGDFPIPDLAITGTEGYRDNAGSNAPTTMERWWTFGGFSAKAGASFPGRYSNVLDVPHAPGAEYADPTRRWDVSGNGNGGAQPGFKVGGVFRREDTVRSIVPEHGDMRLIAATTTPSTAFVKVRDKEWSSAYRFLHIFQNNSGPHFLFGFCNEPSRTGQITTQPFDIPASLSNDQLTASPLVTYHYSRLPEIRPGAGQLYNKYGDFDNGPAQWVDGAYINKPDEGSESVTNGVNGVSYDYWSWNDSTDFTTKFFSPNRVIPSPGMLGSLPVGVKRNLPWTTLLFRPQVSGQPKHPGLTAPVDHQIMDLFWMPVAEPYAISEPFSTGGKVNMNYEIAPFTYIRRTTALHGAFKAELPMVIPNAGALVYKLWDHETNDNGIMPNSPRDKNPTVSTLWTSAFSGNAPFDKIRLPIDMESTPQATLSQFDTKFKSGDLFRSATQICEIHLVRQGEFLPDYQSGKVWANALVTGDNTRERPYTNLYGKLTTKSNAFTVHLRAQVLRKADTGNLKASDWGVWREGRDVVESDYRGSTLIERYLEATDPSLADYATNPNAVLDTAYRMRIISTKKFAP